MTRTFSPQPPASRLAVFGNVVDDARARWEQAEKAWNDAVQHVATTPVRDPEDWKQAIARLRLAADKSKESFETAQAAAEEARKTPLRTIDLKKTRPGVSLGTIAILASPLAVAALLVWRMR
jgi:hypothetical protein